MQQNDFNAIINTWRRLSGEEVKTVVISMSGDSQTHTKKEEEVDLLVPEKNKTPATMNIGTAVAVVDAAADTRDFEHTAEKPGIVHDEQEGKKAAGDGNDKTSESSDKDYLENKNSTIKFPETQNEKAKEFGDKVDSVYLRPPPSRARSTASMDEDDCGIKCLYYTLQCCDCVLM